MKRVAMSGLLAIILSAFLGLNVGAQMLVRYYIIPIEEVGSARGPKYLKWRFGTGTLDVQWSCKDFGATNQMLCAVNAEQVDHDVLLAQGDIVKIPANLDSNVTAAALPTVRAELEALGVPGNWITTLHTYREVVRFVAGLFLFAQRHHDLYNQEIRPVGIDLGDTWGDLSAAWRENLQLTADSFEYDYSGVNASMPLRVILKSLGDQWGVQPIYFGFTTL